MKETFPNEASFQSDERQQWGNDWKTVQTYNNVGTFVQDASNVTAGGLLGAVFRDDYARRKLRQNVGDISAAYRNKAAKGRSSTTIEVAYTKYRPYVILRTTPNHEVVVWSWWQNPQKRLAGDLAGTFLD